MSNARATNGTGRVSKSTDQAGLVLSYAAMHAAAAARLATPATASLSSMTREEHRLEDLKQMAAYEGPVVSFEVEEPYYLASCDHCGWVGSSQLCGTSDADDVHCPRCHSPGADCGKVASAVLAAPAVRKTIPDEDGLSVTADDLHRVEELIIDMRARLRHTSDCGSGCTCYYEPLVQRSRDLLPVRQALSHGTLFAALRDTPAQAEAE